MDILPIACNLNAFTSEQATQHRALWQQIVGAVQSVQELLDGYRVEFGQPALIKVLAEWILLEHLCCPFFHFALRLSPNQALCLELTGGEGVKEFLQSQLVALTK